MGNRRAFREVLRRPRPASPHRSVRCRPRAAGDHHRRGNHLTGPVLSLATAARELHMNADTNIKTIAQVYEACGRGDIAAILDAVTDDIDWAAEASSAAAL